MEALQKFEHAGKTCKIFLDEDPIDPRKDWDNGTIIAHWHPRYDLGEKKISHCSKEELIQEYADGNDPILAILPLYLFDHSGLSVSTRPFGCRWDSGQVGWIFITESTSEKMGWDQLPNPEYEEFIRGDVENLDASLKGECYGYQVLGKDGEVLDSCWGFLGDLDACISGAKEVAETTEDPAIQRDADELASRATFAAG